VKLIAAPPVTQEAVVWLVKDRESLTGGGPVGGDRLIGKNADGPRSSLLDDVAGTPLYRPL
jgi:hypothetical protein